MDTYTGCSMRKIKAEGPTLPTGGELANVEGTWPCEGMTLRDYFAAKAMQALLSNPNLEKEIVKQGGAFGGWIEESAWSWADAMLEGRTR